MTNFKQFYAPEGKRWVVIVDSQHYADYDDKRLAMRDEEFLKEDGHNVEIVLRGMEW